MVRPPKKVHSIYTALREEIVGGTWKTGAKLPNESELAQRFDCSLGTVSKALALLVHEGFVERRARAGTTVIYGSPDSVASQLDAYAFIYPSEQHEGIWRAVRGFQDAARDAGRRVVMLTTGVDYQKETEFVSRLSEFDVRGAVIYPVIPTPQDQVHFSQLLVESRFPVVLAEISLPGLGCSTVVIDGFHAGYTMARHMIQRGARKIGFFSNFAWAPFMRDRYQGYRWALEEAGIGEPAGGVYLDPAMHPDFQDPLAEPTAMAKAFLDRAGKIDAVVCAGDFLAMGCIAAAQQRGWRVPDDLLVSGVDDYSVLAASHGVPLTTYRIPYEDMGCKSFDLLDRVIRGQIVAPEERQLRGEIVIRQSA
ncbi:transcriptional regulator [Spartobacteria bacterium LR76]|nr:transcriptional regulator [Spartobacteria bacterium LR76]